MSRNASSSSSSTGAAAAATGLSLLLETPGLWGVASDILRMLDLKTFVAMERVCKAAERCMAGSGAWRRRLLQVERSRRDPGVTRMLESKVVTQKFDDSSHDEQIALQARHLVRMLAGYQGGAEWYKKCSDTRYGPYALFSYDYCLGPRYLAYWRYMDKEGIRFASRYFPYIKDNSPPTEEEEDMEEDDYYGEGLHLVDETGERGYSVKREEEQMQRVEGNIPLTSLLGGSVDGDGVDFLGEDVAVVVSGHSGGGVEEYQSGGKTYKVSFFDVRSQELLERYEGKKKFIKSAEFKRSKDLLLTVEHDRFYLENMPNIVIQKAFVLRNNEGKMFHVNLEPLVECATFNTLFLLDELDFSEKYLATLSGDAHLKVWRIREEEKTLEEHYEVELEPKKSFSYHLMLLDDFPDLLVHTMPSLSPGREGNCGMNIVDLKRKETAQSISRDYLWAGTFTALRQGADFILAVRCSGDQSNFSFYDISSLDQSGKGPIRNPFSCGFPLDMAPMRMRHDDKARFRVEGAMVMMPDTESGYPEVMDLFPQKDFSRDPQNRLRPTI